MKRKIIAFMAVFISAALMVVPASAQVYEKKFADKNIELPDGTAISIIQAEDGITETEFTLKEGDVQVDNVILCDFNEETGDIVEGNIPYGPGKTFYVCIDLPTGLPDEDYGTIWKLLFLTDAKIQLLSQNDEESFKSTRDVEINHISGGNQIENVSVLDTNNDGLYVRVELKDDPKLFDEPLSFNISVANKGKYTIFGSINADKLPAQYSPFANGISRAYLPVVLDKLAKKAEAYGLDDYSKELLNEDLQEKIIEGRVSIKNDRLLASKVPVTVGEAGYHILGVVNGQTVKKGDLLEAEAHGAGIKNEIPSEKDFRYIPISWQIEKDETKIREGFWSEKDSFDVKINTEEFQKGDYKLNVNFEYQIYDGNKWITKSIVQKSVEFYVDEESKGNIDIDKDNQNGTIIPSEDNENFIETNVPETGDANNSIIMLMSFVMICAFASICIFLYYFFNLYLKRH